MENMDEHTLPLTMVIPTETVLATGEAIILDIGLVFSLQTVDGTAMAIPQIAYANNVHTGKKIHLEVVKPLFGEERIADIVKSIVYTAEFDDDFDPEHKEYFERYVTPYVF